MARHSGNKNARSGKSATLLQNFQKNPIFIVIICIIGIIVFYFLSQQDGIFNSDVPGEGFAVHFIDVGQGDSILIQNPDNEFMLIDTGLNEAYNKLSGYLKNFRVNSFKYVVFTHPHSDHIGSANKIVYNYDIETLIMPVTINSSKTFERLITEIENKNLKITPPRRGDIYQFGEAEFKILAPFSDKYENLNNYSVVIEMRYGETTFLFTGDMEKESENELIDYCNQNGIDIYADVLKAAHHGSTTSSQKKFLDLVNPSFAVIFCGRNNSYNHPHLKIVERLESMGASILRTDSDGDIVISSDGRNLTVQKGRGAAEAYEKYSDGETEDEQYEEYDDGD